MYEKMYFSRKIGAFTGNLKGKHWEHMDTWETYLGRLRHGGPLCRRCEVWATKTELILA